MNLFWRYGYASTTPQALADALSIRKGSLYNTFVSKHHLFTMSLSRYRDMRAETLRGLRDGPGPVRDALRSAMVDLTGAGSHRRGCFAVNSVRELVDEDEDALRIAEALFGDIEDAFRLAVERGQASGEFTADQDAGDRAGSLLATLIGLSVLCRTGAAPDRLHRIVEGALRPL